MFRERHLALLFLTLLSGSALAQTPDSIVASVPGGATVSASELREEVSRLPPQAQAQVLARPSDAAQLARGMVLRREFARQAETEGLDKDPKVATALREARERILAEAALAQAEGPRPDQAALERLARNQYDASPEKFTTPEQVRVRHILVSAKTCNPEERARALLAQARAPGADFAALAREHSDDPTSAPRGGDLGLIARGKAVPAFENAAFALKQPGDLSDVVKTDFGYHVIQLEERIPGGRQSFESVRETIVKNLVDAQRKNNRQLVVEKTESNLQVNRDAIEAVLATRDAAAKPN